MGKRYGVLVVDDSPICQTLICRALEADPELEVVGVCGDGYQAVAETKRLKPSIVTMDVEMPGLNGLAAVERIMAEVPTPILVLTGEPRHQTREALGRALELGALALQIKPTLDAPEQWKLAHEVKLLAQVAVIRHVRGRLRPLPTPTEEIHPGHPLEMIAIGCSTGGPQVIHRLLSELPADFPIPIAIVQHINPSFADSLTSWLSNASKLNVRLAQEGDRLAAGDVLIAPPGRHLWLSGHGRVTLKELPPRDGHIPSATVLLESAALAYGPGALGVVLTGMGADGAEGLAAIKRHGGRGLAQSKESCVVFGMPAAAIARGAVDQVVHAEELSRVLIRLAKGMPIDGG